MTQPTPIQPDLIPWASFLQMDAAQIDATFGAEASRAAVEIVRETRQLTETEETREERQAS